MAISIKSNINGLSGSIQVNGIDAVSIDSTGITAGALPSQSGNGGKVLATNGSTASWQNIGIMDDATRLAQIQAIALCF